jgi:hypothetical protein
MDDLVPELFPSFGLRGSAPPCLSFPFLSRLSLFRFFAFSIAQTPACHIRAEPYAAGHRQRKIRPFEATYRLKARSVVAGDIDES